MRERARERGQRAAFTLAEVLITLGIIGVVAALTMPSLIAKHQKKVILTKLKKSYSTLSQALNRAVADYGDMNTWDLINGVDMITQADNYNKRLNEFMQTHILKYLAVSKDCGRANTKQCRHVNDVFWYGAETYYFFTSDGAAWQVSLNHLKNSDGHNITNGEILFWVDVNGVQGPNEIGKDNFLISVKNNKVEMFTYNKNWNDALYNCAKSNKYSCGWLIQTNGWEYPSDYPIKL